ncbi:uncharacterized protein BX664DRAFT_360006 [Halteromyces radiatus]|uniref:uncharacterized protein n=1 Tax=Halteromyces radiatus TaxID=101107 RepID=UPI00221FEABC|nr:uncharacterized protein BX664DRAFT_360006 [Halteromyces radiatus]KAI8086482.1 hypothetical protein BX664DRAFT_360006 [Halteromyces radiatus]
MTTDPIAQHSISISAYMSGHTNANLAYVRYFGKKKSAIKANFKSLDAYGFTIEYDTPEEQGLETVIPWPTSSSPPLTTRDQVRPLLESMAKEAEEALGMPSSLQGPPPIQAMLKAQALEETERQKEYERQRKRDVFYHADRFWQIPIILGMCHLGYLAARSRIETGPWYAAQIQQIIGLHVIQWMWSISVGLHVGESLIACGICLHRGWYSSGNILRWTISTFFFGFASLSKLLKHGRDMAKLD